MHAKFEVIHYKNAGLRACNVCQRNIHFFFSFSFFMRELHHAKLAIQLVFSMRPSDFLLICDQSSIISFSLQLSGRQLAANTRDEAGIQGMFRVDLPGERRAYLSARNMP